MDSSKVAAESLEWHDAGVYNVEEELLARRMVWQVEVFRWDVGDDGDAQPGHLAFDGVQRVEALHDLQHGSMSGDVYWGVLEAKFERCEETLKCAFMLELPRLRNALGGPGYAELVVTCRDVWFVPAAEVEL